MAFAIHPKDSDVVGQPLNAEGLGPLIEALMAKGALPKHPTLHMAYMLLRPARCGSSWHLKCVARTG